MKFSRVRKSKLKRYISFFLALNIIFEIISPSLAFALTSGPAQEEFASFEPASTTDMVDLYTGDYNYNIPLLSVPGPNGGYPINIAYHSGVGMEQEASWVGLGWNLNVGAINRQLRGLPDDFRGETIKKTQHVKPSVTVGLDIPGTKKKNYIEIIGIEDRESQQLTNNWNVYYNNYRGLGLRYTYNINLPSKPENGPINLGITVDSQNGIGIGLNFSASTEFKKVLSTAGFNLGLKYSSRAGIESLNFTSKFKSKTNIKNTPSKIGVGLSGNSTLSFATSFGVPKANIEMKSTCVPFNLKLGKASAVFKFNAKYSHITSGSVYTSKVNEIEDNVAAYGYLYTNLSTSQNSMKDFNRKDILYSKKIPHLGTSSFTYDLYTQTGQGTGSMFRPHLNTMGILGDPQKISKDRIVNTGLEVGKATVQPGYFHLGLDLEIGGGQNSSGPWTSIGKNSDMGYALRTHLLNWSKNNANNDYEDYYFKVIGEKTGEYSEEHQLNGFGNDKAVRLVIEKEKSDRNWLNRHFIVKDDLVNNESQNSSPIATLNVGNNNIDNQSSSKKRIKRSVSIEALSNEDAIQYGYSKKIKYYNESINSDENKQFNKSSASVSEISMLQPDGMRYVYGLPVFNSIQIDNCFSVLSPSSNHNTTSVAINTSSGKKNIGGVNVGGTFDEFVSKNEMPEYAHSWLLTSVLSNDYLDLTGDGPSDDDYGYWVKFNYRKTSSNYKWRAPYEHANFIEGQKNNPDDDKASYTYGEKEIYIIESVESKTHIAKFETSTRRDAHEALNEFDGGRGTQSMQKLDKIKLFTKQEYFVGNTTVVNTNAVPSKVVNLEYSYDLCPNVPNNDQLVESKTILDQSGNSATININKRKGKLTLNKIYFTYQNSTRGVFSPYIFNYGNLDDLKDNPVYNSKNMDRWGNFKNNSGNYGVSNNTYPFIDHPYTDQDSEYYSSVNNKALKPAPWSLKQINLPTGGVMNIDYDFDDYAFVENKRALRMFDICGLGEDAPLLESIGHAGLQSDSKRNGNALFAPTEARVGTNDPTDDNRVWFKMEGPVASLPDFKARYIDNLPGNFVYFSTYTHLKDDVFDYVKGYAEIDISNSNLYGYQNIGSNWYGYITLKPMPLANKNTTGAHVSPFTRAALEHLRSNRSELINGQFPNSNNPINQIFNLVSAIPVLFNDLLSMAIGFNNYAFLKNWGKTIQLNGYSTIRLCDPDYKKIGGGVRVKKITLNDNWKNDTNSSAAQNSLYGQEYDYTKTLTVNGVDYTISSGVAYEPQMGSEESALKTPIPYSKSTLLHGNYHLFMENPIMEDYYPSQEVGYSKVTMRSIAPNQAKLDNSNNNLNHSSAPVVVYEFYTQKDFPVVFDKTDMNPGQPIFQPLIIPGVYSGTRRRQAKSQGYSVILNDMAGKQKAITTLSKVDGKIISRQEFIYNTEEAYNENSINKLSSKVQTLEVDNNYQMKYVTSVVGQEHDMFIDMNEDSQTSKSFGLNLNLDVYLQMPFPFFIMPLPVISTADNNIRTVVFNKIINRTGILKKVITTTEQSVISSENLAFDISTGEPLLTKVTNEFKDPIYNFSYPGHWYYPNMKGSYQNIGYTIDLSGTGYFNSNSDGSIDLTNRIPTGRKITEFFTKGDLLRINSNNNLYDGNYTVFSVDESSKKLYCINSVGEFFKANTGIESIKVIRSGFKNMLHTKVGALTFKDLNSTFKSFDAKDYLNTYKAQPTSLTIDEPSNKIINASAVEYSDDWQIFGGQALPTTSTCECHLSPVASVFMNMVKSLSLSGNIYSKNLEIHNINNQTYGFGFNSSLLNSSNRLVQIKNALLAITTQTQKSILYSGEIQPNGSLVMYFHGNTISYPTMNADATESVCKVILSPSTNIPHLWENISSINSVSPSLPNTNCDVPSTFMVNLSNVYTNQQGNVVPVQINVSVEAPCNPYPSVCFGKCWDFYEGCNLESYPNYSCGVNNETSINPYLAGMKGMLRPKANYAYNTDRTQNDNIRTDGVYSDFIRFPWENPSTKNVKWKNASTITKYSPFGFELENKDALGNYSSALYGYKNSLAIAVASNSKYNELAFDNFEDYPLSCNESHFKFSNYTSNVVSNISHTGKHSIKVLSGTNPIVTKSMSSNCTFTGISDVVPPIQYNSNNSNVSHIVSSCDLLGEFNPDVNKKYVASVWVQQLSSNNTKISKLVDYTAPKLKVTINKSSGSPLVYTFSPKGNVIDGWQRIFEEFLIPANAISIDVELINTSTIGHTCYFDDIRLHPFDGNMTSYVYDPITLKVLAELDANNYATIYAYDDEGHLYSVKKETTEGIKTIKEGRINTKKINE